MFNARKSQTKPALLLQTITDASRRRKYSPQHLSPGPDIYNIDPALSCSWNVQDFLLPPHTASLTAPLRITNLLEENYNIGSAVACSWKHCLSETQHISWRSVPRSCLPCYPHHLVVRYIVQNIDAMFWTIYFNFKQCNFLTMFQKIAKHRAKDASHTMHRTPLCLTPPVGVASLGW